MKRQLYKQYIKPILDFVAAVILMIPGLPVMLVCAVVIKLDEPNGTILYSQERNGKNGKVFRIYKFRTMRQELCTGLEQPLSSSLTRPGRIIRMLSLDELPQLWNLLKGEMSFVGPRPLPVGYYPWFNETEKKRFLVKPGLTGLAQINGRAQLDWGVRFSLDVQYVEQISFLTDLRIVLATFKRLISHDDVMIESSCALNFDEYRRRQLAKEEGENDNG